MKLWMSEHTNGPVKSSQVGYGQASRVESGLVQSHPVTGSEPNGKYIALGRRKSRDGRTIR